MSEESVWTVEVLSEHSGRWVTVPEPVAGRLPVDPDFYDRRKAVEIVESYQRARRPVRLVEWRRQSPESMPVDPEADARFALYKATLVREAARADPAATHSPEARTSLATAEGRGGGMAGSASSPAAAPVGQTEVIGNLEWQVEVPEKFLTWEEAKVYAESLGNGWRLPNIHELFSLVDVTRQNPACSVFPDCPPKFFWSSSPDVDLFGYAWGAHFYSGYSDCRRTHFSNCVRLVRDVKP
jgi:hypothetical protein